MLRLNAHRFILCNQIKQKKTLKFFTHTLNPIQYIKNKQKTRRLSHRIFCQSKKKIRFYHLSKIYEINMYVFHRLSLWNCSISIFGLWRSTRATIGKNSYSIQLLRNLRLVASVKKRSGSHLKL